MVILFWQMAIHERDFAEVNDEAMAQWRELMRNWIGEAIGQGVLRGDVQPGVAAESLSTFLLGSQVVAVLDAGFNDPSNSRASWICNCSYCECREGLALPKTSNQRKNVTLHIFPRTLTQM